MCGESERAVASLTSSDTSFVLTQEKCVSVFKLLLVRGQFSMKVSSGLVRLKSGSVFLFSSTLGLGDFNSR